MKSWLAVWLGVRRRRILERDPGGERRRASLGRMTGVEGFWVGRRCAAWWDGENKSFLKDNVNAVSDR